VRRTWRVEGRLNTLRRNRHIPSIGPSPQNLSSHRFGTPACWGHSKAAKQRHSKRRHKGSNLGLTSPPSAPVVYSPVHPLLWAACQANGISYTWPGLHHPLQHSVSMPAFDSRERKRPVQLRKGCCRCGN